MKKRIEWYVLNAHAIEGYLVQRWRQGDYHATIEQLGLYVGVDKVQM